MAERVGRAVTAAAVAVAVSGWLIGSATSVEAAQRHSTIRYETHHDSSIPLAQIVPVPVSDEPQEAEPIQELPNHSRGVHHDPVTQAWPAGPAAPTLGAGFDGLGQGFTGPGGTFTVTLIPPDTNAAVGSSQIVEIVNNGFAVFSKTGTVLYGPAATNTLFSGFGGPCQTTDDGDAVVRYDALANRWIITQFANVHTSGPYYECIAVSQTSSATGSWYRYSFQYTSVPDYPKLSVWTDAYYITYNLYNGAVFVGAEDCAMNRSAMLAGAAATQQCFTTSSSYGGLLGADFEGGTAPPSGEANTVLALGLTSTSIAYWRFHVDWVTPANTTFTGPTSITVAAYTKPCGSNCVPQSSTSQRLDSLGDRLMFRAAYRNLGDHEAVVVDHSVSAYSAIAVRWYELRNLSGAPTLFQQGTYGASGTYRWMGSVAMDKVGNIGLGYSVSSTTIHPGIRVAGWLITDPPGTITHGETFVLSGAGSQTGRSRWGDYSSMTVDPIDGCTFWYAQEYIPANGSFNWKTHLHSFTLPDCLPLIVDIDGPGLIPQKGTYTYTALYSNFDPNPAFSWSERFCNDSGCTSWVNLGVTGSSFNRVLSPDCSGSGANSYEVNLVMTNADGRTASADHTTWLCLQ